MTTLIWNTHYFTDATGDTKYRYDVCWGESNADRAARYEREGLRYRKDGKLDRRYSRSRWIEDYRAGKLRFG